jgi:tRNA A37 methylthiotransferase MiaB
LRFYYDFIVGYPAETDAAFEDTLDFVWRYPPSCGMIADFSREEGTDAALLPSVAPETVNERRKRLRTMHRMACAKKGVPTAPWGDDGAGTLLTQAASASGLMSISPFGA